MLTVNNNVYIIVISVEITVNYCKCILLFYIPLNSYGYVHWTNNKDYFTNEFVLKNNYMLISYI